MKVRWKEREDMAKDRFKRGNTTYKEGPMAEAWLARPDIPKKPVTDKELKEQITQWNKFVEVMAATETEWDFIIERDEEIRKDELHKNVDSLQAKRDQLRKDAKLILQRRWGAVGRKLCKREYCTQLIPLGSRDDREYCSSECKAAAANKRARDK